MTNSEKLKHVAAGIILGILLVLIYSGISEIKVRTEEIGESIKLGEALAEIENLRYQVNQCRILHVRN